MLEFRLVIFLQVHAVVETRHLVAVAIEHLSRRALEKPRQANFLGLAPARVVHFGIHVGVETVFMGVCNVPGCWGLILDKSNLDQRLGTLESVFPRNDRSDGRAIRSEEHTSE